MATKGERDRAYQVLMWAISEENRLGLLSREELAQRQKEAWESAYGDEPKRTRRAQSKPVPQQKG